MSFNPNTGLVYIPTTNGSSFNYSVDQKFEENYKPGQQNWGVVRGSSGSATPPPPSIGPLPAEGQRSALVAWDPVTQTERWRVPGGGSTGGGTVTTAGNLVFQIVPDGRLLAYSADKGQKLLEIQTGLRSGMGPPTTYEVDGTQYVAVMGGLGRTSTVSAEAAAANGGAAAGGNTQRTNAAASPVLPKLLVFALDRTAPLPGTSQGQ
jgi:quinohemoprotein ethanol dehydrogenase